MISSHGPSSCQVAEADQVKMFMNASISEMHADPITDLFCADIQDFYLRTPLDKPVFIHIHTRLTIPAAHQACDLEQYIVDDQIWFQVNRSMFIRPPGVTIKAYWYHAYTLTISTTKSSKLVVDAFLVKTKSKAAIKHF